MFLLHCHLTLNAILRQAEGEEIKCKSSLMPSWAIGRTCRRRNLVPLTRISVKTYKESHHLNAVRTANEACAALWAHNASTSIFIHFFSNHEGKVCI
jgi:hypothetical protein